MSEFPMDDMDAINNEISKLTEQRDELLAALKELVEYDEGSNEPGDFGYDVLLRCKAAIAKAEGRGE